MDAKESAAILALPGVTDSESEGEEEGDGPGEELPGSA